MAACHSVSLRDCPRRSLWGRSRADASSGSRRALDVCARSFASRCFGSRPTRLREVPGEATADKRHTREHRITMNNIE